MTQTERHPHERFVLLDGLRGIAAIFIIQRHAEDLLGNALPSSYLGVDLFFGLSGFVLAHAYGAALRDGRMSTRQFMRARLMRLYPLYGFALALVSAYYIFMFLTGQPVFFGQFVIPQELAASILTGLFFLPAPFTISFNAALFLVHPAWSLFDELIANIAYALKGARARVGQMIGFIAICAVVLVIAAIEFERLHAGFRWHEMYAGLGRVFFSFSVGVLIYRFRRKVPRVRSLQALLCLAVLCIVLTFPTPKDMKAPFDLFIVFLVWPTLLYVASGIVPGPVTAAVSNFLGTASYAVYVLHVPLFDWAHVLWPGMAAPGIAPFAGVALISIVVILSWYLTVKVDQPLQKRLKQRMPGRKPLTQ